MEICDQNSPHGLAVGSKLRLRRRTDLLGLWTTESLTAATLCGVLDDFGRPECDCLLVSTFEVMHSPMGSELVDPSADH